jgi:hypothetical protein
MKDWAIFVIWVCATAILTIAYRLIEQRLSARTEKQYSVRYTTSGGTITTGFRAVSIRAARRQAKRWGRTYSKRSLFGQNLRIEEVKEDKE